MRGPKKSTCPVAKTARCFQSRLSSTVEWVTERRNGHIFIFIFVAVREWAPQSKGPTLFIKLPANFRRDRAR